MEIILQKEYEEKKKTKNTCCTKSSQSGKTTHNPETGLGKPALINL